MQLDPQGGDDAEATAAAPYCPEQLGLLIRTGRHAPPVREHHLGPRQLVRCRAVLTVERAIAAAQGEASHADFTIVAQCRNQIVETSGGSHVLDLCSTGDSAEPGRNVKEMRATGREDSCCLAYRAVISVGETP
jgi:hypothetical protein